MFVFLCDVELVESREYSGYGEVDKYCFEISWVFGCFLIKEELGVDDKFSCMIS